MRAFETPARTCKPPDIYSVAPVAGVFIVVIQLINIWEDITGIELIKKETDEVEEEELGL